MKIRLLIYNALIKPYLEYGILSWGNAKNKFIKGITIAQKKAVRLVSNKHYRHHADPLFAELELLKMEDIMQLKVNEFMFKYYNGFLPSSFNNMYEPLCNNNRTACFRIDVPKYENLHYFPAISFPRIWNRINIDYKKAKSTSILKKSLKETFFLKYSSFKCKLKNCYSCSY